MREFKIEAVGGKRFKDHKMPPANEVDEKLKELWEICFGIKPDPSWTPSGEFSFRERTPGDLVFRVRDFERGREDGVTGLDLLGRYRRYDSLVTIYIDSYLKAARRYKVECDGLVDVVLVHELAHLMTHRGFDVDDLSSSFMEHTAQCATYAYLKPRGDEALKAFELLSTYQPFIYRTWEWLKELPEPHLEVLYMPDKVQEVVRAFFQYNMTSRSNCGSISLECGERCVLATAKKSCDDSRQNVAIGRAVFGSASMMLNSTRPLMRLIKKAVL
jgi:hypothetical protein